MIDWFALFMCAIVLLGLFAGFWALLAFLGTRSWWPKDGGP